MSVDKQKTLTQGECEHERERPDTFLYAPETDEYILRSRRFDVDLELIPVDEQRTEVEDDDSPYDAYDADDKVGGVYSVEIHRSVEYRFKLPAVSEHRAKEIAEEMALDATPAVASTVHTRTDERDEIQRDELPDDYDPFGGERLIDVFEENNEEDEDGAASDND